MSLYNMIHGVSGATYWVLPMLGHHPHDFPRFRDCFTSDDDHPEYDDCIHVYTRTGGGNRDGYEEENDWIRSIPGFVADFDDSFDCTYASWVFEVPEEWKSDFEAIKERKIGDISDEYIERLNEVYPNQKEELQSALLATQGVDAE